MNNVASCPVCRTSRPLPVLDLRGVPLDLGRLHPTPRDGGRHHIDLRACGHCGLVWNHAFDPGRLTGPPVEEARPASSRIVQRLVATHDLQDRLVVSPSAADAPLLAALCRGGGARAMVLDPAHRDAPPVVPGIEFCDDDPGRLREVPRLIVLRGLLEQVADPVACLRDLGRMAGSGTTVYLEVSDATTLYAEEALWRLAYRRPVHFTPPGLVATLRASGLAVSRLTTEDGRLCVEATRAALAPTTSPPGDPAGARRFGRNARRRLDDWQQQLSELAAGHARIALWGVSGPGLALASLVPAADRLALLVDPDPRRQGRYPPGRDLPVASPLALRKEPCDLVLTADAAGGLTRLDLHRPDPLTGARSLLCWR